MSNALTKSITLSAITQIVASTVPVVERRVIGPRQPAGLADDRFILQEPPSLVERPNLLWLLKVTDVGAHATFTATLDGSETGQATPTDSWISLAFAVVSQPLTGLTINEFGLTASAALFTSGLALVARGSFPFYRIGLSGNAAAADGAGRFGVTFSRET